MQAANRADGTMVRYHEVAAKHSSMRAVPLLVCAALGPARAFSSLPEQLEARDGAGKSTHMKVASNAYCSNRKCAGGSCTQSRTTEDAAACAAAVMKDPECGNSFSFGENTNRKLRYCDCPPPGQPCVASFAAFYHVYELIFDKTECSKPPEQLEVSEMAGPVVTIGAVNSTSIEVILPQISLEGESFVARYDISVTPIDDPPLGEPPFDKPPFGNTIHPAPPSARAYTVGGLIPATRYMITVLYTVLHGVNAGDGETTEWTPVVIAQTLPTI